MLISSTRFAFAMLGFRECGLRLDEDHQGLGHHAVMVHRLGPLGDCITAMSLSMSATSMLTATRAGSAGR